MCQVNTMNYYMARRSEHCHWFFLGWDLAIQTISVELWSKDVYFFRKKGNSKFVAKMSAI